MLLGGQAPVRADEFSQTFHYSARMFSFGTLTIDTRMGNVQVESWDQPRLEIDAEKVVEAGNQKKAEPLYDQVQVVLTGRTSRFCCAPFIPRAGCGGHSVMSRSSP